MESVARGESRKSRFYSKFWTITRCAQGVWLRSKKRKCGSQPPDRCADKHHNFKSLSTGRNKQIFPSVEWKSGEFSILATVLVNRTTWLVGIIAKNLLTRQKSTLDCLIRSQRLIIDWNQFWTISNLTVKFKNGRNGNGGNFRNRGSTQSRTD